MLSSGIASILLGALLCAFGAVAVVVGFIATGALGLGWSWRTGLADAAVGAVSYVACALLLAALGFAEGVAQISAAALAVLSPVLRHVAQRLFRGSSNVAAP